ncbi:MAG: ABC transporter substrate-binding protein [Nevskiaceae bacterium]|nr:ABC transporter substrate-binding protein [Nevskiaceae bacterium]
MNRLFNVRKMAWSAALAALLLMALPEMQNAQAAAAIDASNPQTLVQSSSQALLADLDANRAAYRKDISLLQKSIEQNFLPYFDMDYSAQQVLGKYWRDATAEQRQRFKDAFYTSLMRTYGDALVDFTADQMKVLPFQGDAAANRATVRSEVRRSSGAPVAVNYTLRKLPDGKWKVWDVVIEGISYVKSFREDYGLVVEQQGLEALIKRIESQAAGKGK